MQTQARQTEPSPTTSAAAKPQLVAVDPRRVREALELPAVRALLADMVQRHHGELSMYGIAERLLSGEWIMWLVWAGEVRAVLATELYHDVGGEKRCRIPFCTGAGARQWVSLLSVIEDWARSEGAVRIDMIARKGWAKHLPDYRMTHIVLEKAL